MATRDGTGEQTGMTGTSSVTIFFPIFLFPSSHIYYLFCRKLQQQTGRGLVGQDRTGQSGQRQGGTGGRRAGGGGRRREEGGLAGNMMTAEAGAQVTKGRE